MSPDYVWAADNTTKFGEYGCADDDEIKLGCTNCTGNFSQNPLLLYQKTRFFLLIMNMR